MIRLYLMASEMTSKLQARFGANFYILVKPKAFTRSCPGYKKSSSAHTMGYNSLLLFFSRTVLRKALLLKGTILGRKSLLHFISKHVQLIMVIMHFISLYLQLTHGSQYECTNGKTFLSLNAVIFNIFPKRMLLLFSDLK